MSEIVSIDVEVSSIDLVLVQVSNLPIRWTFEIVHVPVVWLLTLASSSPPRHATPKPPSHVDVDHSKIVFLKLQAALVRQDYSNVRTSNHFDNVFSYLSCLIILLTYSYVQLV